MTSKAHSSSNCSPRKFDEKIALLKANESESNEKFDRLLCELNVLKGHLNPSSRRTVSTPNVANVSSGVPAAAVVNDSSAAAAMTVDASAAAAGPAIINSSAPVPIAAGGWYSTNAAAAAAAIAGSHFPAGCQYGGSNCNVSCTSPATLTGCPSCPLVAASQYVGGCGGGGGSGYASSTQCTPKRRVRDMVMSRVQRSHPYSPTRDRFFPGSDQQHFHYPHHHRPQHPQQHHPEQQQQQQRLLQHQQSQNHQLLRDEDLQLLPLFPQPRRASSDTNIAERLQRCSPLDQQLADDQHQQVQQLLLHQQQQLMMPQSALQQQQIGVQFRQFQQPLLQDDMIRLSLGSFGDHYSGHATSVSCSASYAEQLSSAGAAAVSAAIPEIQVTHSMCQSPTLFCDGSGGGGGGAVADVPDSLQDQLGLFETDEDMNNAARRDSYTMATEVLAGLGSGGGGAGVDDATRLQQPPPPPPPPSEADATLLH